MNAFKLLVAALTVILLAPTGRAQVSNTLHNASQMLFSGRSYLVGFPGSKTRNGVRKSYLGMANDGALTGTPSRPQLQEALNAAVGVRYDLGATLVEDEVAQVLAWESLEALLNGQLIAGNSSLLRGLRLAFPNATGDEKPPGESDVPVGCPVTSAGQPYLGGDVKDLCYARQYFLEGITGALDFMAIDRTGELRYFEPLNTPFEQYTYFNTNAALLDGNYTNGPVPIQTAGYLLGNILDRYGKSVIGMGDKLWRAAYFHRDRAPGGSRAAERGELLNWAMQTMQQGAHAQFLAALPLAATMNEGETGYERCRIDQVRVTVATASTLIDRIRRGEVPKLNDLALNASTLDIQQQISQVNSLFEECAQRYTEAQGDLWKKRDSEAAAVGDAQQLRFGFTEQLVTATLLDPGDENVPPYFGLTTAAGRIRYREDLYAKVDAAFRAEVGDAVLNEGSELGQTILQMRRAFNDVTSAKNRIDSIPQQIRIEQDRVGLVNDVTMGTANKVAAYQMAIGLAQAFQPSINSSVDCVAGVGCAAKMSVGLNVNPNQLIIAGLQNDIARAQTLSTIKINNINLEAFIRNKLLEQHQLILDMKSSVIQAQLAIAAVRQLLARIDRVVENHIYYQDSNRTKWYYDPALVFEQERSETLYQDKLRDYINNLYLLAVKLSTRWSEVFENPYLNSQGIPATLVGTDFELFTQPESVFNCRDHFEGRAFQNALKQWDLTLRGARQGGQADILSTISLRQDVFGFSDVVYNTNTLRFETIADPVARSLNRKRFRALLLASKQPAASPYWLRLEFPVSYGQLSRIVTGNTVSQPALILASRSDWNIRMTELSARVVGQNVAQNANNLLRVDLVQHGKIEIPKYHPRQVGVYPNFLTFNLPLYYPDPMEVSVTPFKFSLNAGINGNAGQNNGFIAQVEPSPFCDRWVLLIEKAANPPVNVENIEDIVISMKSRSSIPPAFFN